MNCKKCNNTLPLTALHRFINTNGDIHFNIKCPYCQHNYNAPQNKETAEIFSKAEIITSKKLTEELNSRDLFDIK